MAAQIAFSSIDHNTPVPLYYQLKQAILSALKSGLIAVGDKLPTEMEICDMCGVSRQTVRQAVIELVSDGYLYREKGKGTFAAERKISGSFLNRLTSFNEEMRQKGLTPSTRVLKQEVLQGRSPVSEKLRLDPSEDLIHLERVRSADGVPIVYLDTYVPRAPYERLLKEDFESNSLYVLLEQIYGVKVTRVSREIEAANANARDAGFLGIARNKAIHLVKTVGFTNTDKVAEYSVARYRGDVNRFTVELYRE